MILIKKMFEIKNNSCFIVIINEIENIYNIFLNNINIIVSTLL